jgi:LemA protein
MTDAETVAMDQQVSSAIGKIMVAVENYPDLKASENFINLQASLNEVEEQISAARRAYNASVKDYNNALEMFPSNIVARLMRYQQKVFFEIRCPGTAKRRCRPASRYMKKRAVRG